MKRKFIPLWIGVIMAVLVVGWTASAPFRASETRTDYVLYSGTFDFTVDSTTTQTSEGFFIGSMYDQAMYVRALIDVIRTDTHDVNLLVDFYVLNTWDQYSTVAADSVNETTVVWDTLSTITGVAPLQFKMAKYIRLRADPQTGHSASRLNYVIKIPRTGRWVPNDVTF